MTKKREMSDDELKALADEINALHAKVLSSTLSTAKSIVDACRDIGEDHVKVAYGLTGKDIKHIRKVRAGKANPSGKRVMDIMRALASRDLN